MARRCGCAGDTCNCTIEAGTGIVVTPSTNKYVISATVPASVILTGTASPTAGLGVVGNYYLETDINILWGPKQASAPEWPIALYGLPPGGTTGQSLKKTSNANYAVAWVT